MGTVLASTNDARAELAIILREREAMTFTPTTAEVVIAAREVVASAERLRIAECGAGNERRGPSCRKRQADEQAKREALSTVTVNKAAADRAAALDADTAIIRARLEKAQAVQSINPGAATISRLLHIEVDDAVSLSALLGALALELAGMAAMMRADAHGSVREATRRTLSEPQAGTANLADGRPAATPALPRVTASIETPSTEPNADTVGRFMLACLKRAKGEQVAGGAIYARYQRWCAEQKPALASLDARPFAQQFADRCARVGIHTRREGKKVYCLDALLAA
jgi:hypothetical protein